MNSDSGYERLEVDVQCRIQSAEDNELFIQPFLKFLVFYLDLSTIFLLDLLNSSTEFELDS